MAETTAGHHADPSGPEPHPPKGHPRLDPLPETRDEVNEAAVANFNTTQSSEKRNARSAGLLVAVLVIVGALWAWDPVTWWKSQDAPPAPPRASEAAKPPPPQHAGLCPPGEVRPAVGAPCVPKGSMAPPSTPQAPPAAPAPTPIVASVPGTAAGTIWVCDKEKGKKEKLTDYQLIGGGISISVFNPLKCEFSLDVKPGGTIRVTFYDNSQMDMNHQTCAIPTNPGCRNRLIKSIASVTPSSIIMLEVTPR